MIAGATLVTVVIPTRNRLPLLQEAVASVLSQSLDSIELFVIDDASTDDTWDWLSRQRDERLHAIRLQRHSERSVARNRGLADARADYVMFLDDDDRLRPRALQRSRSFLVLDPAAVAVVCARSRFVEWGDAVRIPHPRRPARRVIWPELLFGWVAVSGQVLYRTAVVREVGGFEKDLHRVQDRDLWLRVARVGPVLLAPPVTVEYRVHEGQLHSPEDAQIREQVYADFMESLPEEERPSARRIRIAGRASARADESYAFGAHREALVHELRALRAAPWLYSSPLIGPPRLLRLARSARSVLSGRSRR